MTKTLLQYRPLKNIYILCLQNHCHWTRYMNHSLKSTLHITSDRLLSPSYDFFPIDIRTKILYVLLVSSTSNSNATYFTSLLLLSPASLLLGPNIFGGRLRFKCDGTRAETRFRLSAKRTSPFKSAGASVQSTTGSRGVRISGSSEVV